MKIAIYSRKSKLTETGDSIQNQINICKDYAKTHFGNSEFFIYEDEGFSGGNTDRPMFKKLIKDVHNKKIEVLICYRLDRISRNVNDFSTTLKILEYNNVAFVSVTEQFDTSTPLGKAMLSIASVFAELERDTIAQRITDNFTELAKTGRYLNANPPEGFTKRQITGENGKRYNVLETVPHEAEKIKLIYKKYLEWESNTKVESFCFQNGLKTKAGKTITADWITRVLTHQLYAAADEYIYEYFKSLGSQIISGKEKFDGKHGLTIFRRTKSARGRHSTKNDPEEFIIGVGSHEGIICSQDWIKTQNIVNKRKHLFTRKATGGTGILNGILRCANCGDYMRPTTISNNRFYYTCITKEKSNKSLCSNKNLNHTVDKNIIETIKKALNTKNNVLEKLKQYENNIKSNTKNNLGRISEINKQIKSNEKSISNLIIQLSKTESETLVTHITEQVEKMDLETKELKKELILLEEESQSNEMKQINIEVVKNAIYKLKNTSFDNIEDILVKRNILKTITKNIYWDGREINIEFQ